jgi:hypothetical protein
MMKDEVQRIELGLIMAVRLCHEKKTIPEGVRSDLIGRYLKSLRLTYLANIMAEVVLPTLHEAHEACDAKEKELLKVLINGFADAGIEACDKAATLQDQARNILLAHKEEFTR